MKIKSQYKDDFIIVNDKKVFTINEENKKIIKLMSDTLYSNKLESVFREIFSNSIDACLMNKDNNKGIELSYDFITSKVNDDDISPNYYNFEEFYISFRDYGPGISKDNIVDIYCTFFQSSKSDTNKQIGGYGLGCKSPIAITQEYYVYSYYNKIKYHYKITNYDELKIELIKEEETNEDNGIEVKIPFYSKHYSNTTELEKLINNIIPEFVSVCPIEVKLKIYKDSIFIHEGIVNSYIKLDNNLVLSSKINYFKVLNYLADHNLTMDNSVRSDNVILYNKDNNSAEYKNIAYHFINDLNILNGCIPYKLHNYIDNLDNITQNKIKKYILDNLKKTYAFDSPIIYYNIQFEFNSTNKDNRVITFRNSYNSRVNGLLSLNVAIPIGSIELDTSRENILQIESNQNTIHKSIDYAINFMNNVKIKGSNSINDTSSTNDNHIFVSNYYKIKYHNGILYRELDSKVLNDTSLIRINPNPQCVKFHKLFNKVYNFPSGKDYSELDNYLPLFHTSSYADIFRSFKKNVNITFEEVKQYILDRIPEEFHNYIDFTIFKNRDAITICEIFVNKFNDYDIIHCHKFNMNILHTLGLTSRNTSNNINNKQHYSNRSQYVHEINKDLDLLFG